MRYIVFIALLVFTACSGSKMIETNLYFGMSKPDGGMITEKEWNDFNENYISKVFKDGSSMTHMTGNWYDTAAHKMITEPSYMVTCDYKPSAALSRQIDSLRYWYKKLFIQQAVLRVDKKVKASF